MNSDRHQLLNGAGGSQISRIFTAANARARILIVKAKFCCWVDELPLFLDFCICSAGENKCFYNFTFEICKHLKKKFKCNFKK